MARKHDIESQPPADPNFDSPALDPEDLMDQAAKQSSTGFEKLPPGNYAAVVDSVNRWESDKGLFWRWDLYVWTETNPAFKHALFCHMLREDMRTPHEWGPGFYNQYMASLGYDKANNGKEARLEIAKEKPGIAIQVTVSKQNPEYVNTKIKSRLSDDNEEIQEIRSAMEARPY
jgi:hypothetical protein